MSSRNTMNCSVLRPRDAQGHEQAVLASALGAAMGALLLRKPAQNAIAAPPSVVRTSYFEGRSVPRRIREWQR